MDVPTLIQLVQQNRCLYDLLDPHYYDFAYKDRIWEAIGATLNISGAQCKLKWTAIRDTYRRSLKSRPDSSQCLCKYRYENYLSFIIPHFRERGAQPVAAEVQNNRRVNRRPRPPKNGIAKYIYTRFQGISKSLRKRSVNRTYEILLNAQLKALQSLGPSTSRSTSSELHQRLPRGNDPDDDSD